MLDQLTKLVLMMLDVFIVVNVSNHVHGSLRERDNVDDVFDLLHEEGIYTVVQIAPATRAGLGEEFGLPMN